MASWQKQADIAPAPSICALVGLRASPPSTQQTTCPGSLHLRALPADCLFQTLILVPTQPVTWVHRMSSGFVQACVLRVTPGGDMGPQHIGHQLPRTWDAGVFTRSP